MRGRGSECYAGFCAVSLKGGKRKISEVRLECVLDKEMEARLRAMTKNKNRVNGGVWRSKCYAGV